MKNRLITALMLFLAIGIIFSESPADDPLDLSLRLYDGDRYTCIMDMTQTVTQTIEGEEQTLNQVTNISWSYDITGTDDDGIINLTMSYDRIWVKQDFGFHSSEYDSENPPSYMEPAMKGYTVLVGSRLEIRMDNKGKVLSIDGAGELIDRMIAEMNLPDSPMKDQIVASLRKQFGEQALTESIAQITSFYPPEPVKRGQEWSSETATETGFPMRIQNVYTLLSRHDSIAAIKVESAIISSADSAGMDMGPVKIHYDISGAQSGIIDVDEASGLPVRSEIDMGFEGTVNISGIPEKEPQSWPIKANGRVVVTIEKK